MAGKISGFNPFGLFHLGLFKIQILFDRSENTEELKLNIRQEIRSITPKITENTQQGFVKRLNYCLVVNSQQFEHLI